MLMMKNFLHNQIQKKKLHVLMDCGNLIDLITKILRGIFTITSRGVFNRKLVTWMERAKRNKKKAITWLMKDKTRVEAETTIGTIMTIIKRTRTWMINQQLNQDHVIYALYVGVVIMLEMCSTIYIEDWTKSTTSNSCKCGS